MSIRQSYVFAFINKLSKKYAEDFSNMHLEQIKKILSKDDWNKLSHIVKYGKELH